LGNRLEFNRGRRSELAVRLTASKCLSIAWRMFVFKRRLRALWKVRTLARPLIFWWRFNFHIRRKRNAAATLLEYTRARARLGNVNQCITRFCHAVRKIQVQWREMWKLLQMQLDICSMMWIMEDEKRGLSHTAALFKEVEEKHARLALIREDLRERKAAHQARVLKYKKQMREYNEWLEEQKIFEEARRMIAGDEAVVTSASDALVEKRKPPSRPVFMVFGPKGHFKVLGDRLLKQREVDQRQAERDWRRADSIRMQEYVHDAEEKAAEEKMRFRRGSTFEADSPATGKGGSPKPVHPDGDKGRLSLIPEQADGNMDSQQAELS